MWIGDTPWDREVRGRAGENRKGQPLPIQYRIEDLKRGFPNEAACRWLRLDMLDSDAIITEVHKKSRQNIC